jgi:aminoglycoside phosphotransferase (APT) family kinase protein
MERIKKGRYYLGKITIVAKTFVPSRAIIEKIISAHNLGAINHIKHLEGGFSSPVVNVNDQYIIKLNKGSKPLHLEKLTREVYLYKLLSKNVPVPEVVVFDATKNHVPFYYLVTTFLQGDSLKSTYSNLTISQQNEICHKIGEYLQIIHKTEITNGQSFSLDNKSNWKDKVLKAVTEHYYNFKSKNIFLLEEQREDIEQTLSQFKDLKDEKIPKKLIHHDFNANHIIIKESQINGFIDFEWACLGDPFWDLQKLPIGFGVGPEFKAQKFLVGYNKTKFIDEEIIRLKTYCFDQGLWQIYSTMYEDHGYPKEMIQQGYDLIDRTISFTESLS